MRLLATLQRRMRLMLGRGLARLIDDAGGLQVVQVQLLEDEVRELEHYQPYGFTYYPPDGGEPVFVAPDGVRANAMVLAIAHRAARLKNLAKGESALYDDQGQKVHLQRAGIFVVTTLNATIQADGTALVKAGGKATIEAGATVEIKGATGAAVKGIVQGDCICAYTGAPHPHISATVKGSA